MPVAEGASEMLDGSPVVTGRPYYAASATMLLLRTARKLPNLECRHGYPCSTLRLRTVRVSEETLRCAPPQGEGGCFPHPAFLTPSFTGHPWG